MSSPGPERVTGFDGCPLPLVSARLMEKKQNFTGYSGEEHPNFKAN